MKIKFNKKKLSYALYILSAAFLVASLLLTLSPALLVFAAGGVVWTTDATCVSQNLNKYSEGQTVYLRGVHFIANTEYDWVLSNPSGSTVFDSGTITTDGTGYFCAPTHTVGTETGTFKMTVVDDQGSKLASDNFTVSAEIQGCMDTNANNYDPSATSDDGTCQYDICYEDITYFDVPASELGSYPGFTYGECTPPPEVLGCTNPNATNYDDEANTDDGSCLFTICYENTTYTDVLEADLVAYPGFQNGACQPETITICWNGSTHYDIPVSELYLYHHYTEGACEDMCNNIDGVQTSIPDGYQSDGEGGCKLTPTATASPILPTAGMTKPFGSFESRLFLLGGIMFLGLGMIFYVSGKENDKTSPKK